MSRRDFLRMGAAAATGTLVTACGPFATPSAEPVALDEPVTIRYWFYETPEREALGRQQVEEFQQLHPNITVEGMPAPPGVDNEDLLTHIAAGGNSHIHQSYYKEDLWYVDHDVIIPLEDFPGFADVLDSLEPRCNTTYQGHVFSLSWYFDGSAVAYNRKLVEEAGLDAASPPTTYSEFLNWAEVLTQDTDGDGEVDQWFMAPPLGEEWWWWDFVLSPFYIAATGSGNFLDEAGTTPIFNTPEAVKPYGLFETIYRAGYAPRTEPIPNSFARGQVAAQYPCWMRTHGDLWVNARPDFQYFMGPIPKPDGSEVEGNKTFLFVRNLALVKEQYESGEQASRIVRAAWEFLKFLLSPEQMLADYRLTGDPPAAKGVLTSALYDEITDQLGEQMRWQMGYVLEQGQLGDMTSPKSVDCTGILQQAYLSIVRDDVPSEEAIDIARERVVELLAE